MSENDTGSFASILGDLLTERGLLSDPPGAVQIQIDVQVCLVSAMVQTFGGPRERYKADTVPSEDPVRADAGAWGICLTRFERILQECRPVYSVYYHQARFVDATLDLALTEIRKYLYARLLEQLDEALK